MTLVEFFQVRGDLENALAFTSRLVTEAYRRQRDILVQFDDDQHSMAIRERLCAHCAAAALPWASQPEERQAISISRGDGPGHHQGLLIHFGTGIPGWHGRFERLVEILYDDDPSLEARRQHYRFFRERGYPLRFRRLPSDRGDHGLVSARSPSQQTVRSILTG